MWEVGSKGVGVSGGGREFGMGEAECLFILIQIRNPAGRRLSHQGVPGSYLGDWLEGGEGRRARRVEMRGSCSHFLCSFAESNSLTYTEKFDS